MDEAVEGASCPGGVLGDLVDTPAGLVGTDDGFLEGVEPGARGVFRGDIQTEGLQGAERLGGECEGVGAAVAGADVAEGGAAALVTGAAAYLPGLARSPG